MKKYMILIMMSILSSCTVTKFYQVYKTSVEDGKFENNKIIFEDGNCIVSYDLWAEGGDIGFSIFNKTQSYMSIHLDKTFFVVNGIAYKYYQNRIFSNASKLPNSVTSFDYPNFFNIISIHNEITQNNSTSFIEMKERTIPPKTKIKITEFHIANERYSNCDLLEHPSKKDIKSVTFDKKNSPYVFYNLITYSLLKDTVRLENNFYVSEITNYPEPEITTRLNMSSCGRRLSFPITVLKNASPDKFYFSYKRGF